jgi:hypothetical protein
MRKIKLSLPLILVSLAFNILLISHYHSSLAAPNTPLTPPIPDQVYGLVKVNGIFVPAGTFVSAWCGGVKFAEKATINYNGETWYSLDIPGDDLTTPAKKEGCSNGETISFKISTDYADQTKNWTEGNSSQLDLSIANLIKIYIPVVMK